MAKPTLKEALRTQCEMIETMLAGLHEWRPDLKYPESHSDMQRCVRALLRVYKVERRHVAIYLEYAEVERRLNEYPKLKKATDALSADLVEAIAIMDEKGRTNPEGNSQMLFNDWWNRLRDILLNILEGKDD